MLLPSVEDEQVAAMHSHILNGCCEQLLNGTRFSHRQPHDHVLLLPGDAVHAVNPACHQWKCSQSGCWLLLQDAAEAAARAAALAEAEQAAAERAAMERRVQHQLEVRGGWACAILHSACTHTRPAMPLLLCTCGQCDAAGHHPGSPAMLQAQDGVDWRPQSLVNAVRGCHCCRCCSPVGAVIKPPCCKLMLMLNGGTSL